MNINPNAAAFVAGTSRAAARGGETDNQATHATSQQSTADKPGGKDADSAAVDAGDQTDDRGANGQQMWDRFERSGEEENKDTEETPQSRGSATSEGSGDHLDLEA